MRHFVFLAAIAGVSATTAQLRPNTDEAVVTTGTRPHRALGGINLYTDRNAWLTALASSDFEAAAVDFSSIVAFGSAATTLSVGANDVGLFDIVLTSVADASTATSAGVFTTVYERGSMEVTFNNFNEGNVFGFGANWDVEDEAGVNTEDFKLLVDGASVDLGSFPSSRGLQYGIGFVGLIATGSDGFEEIVFASDGNEHTHIKMSQISVGYATPDPTPAPSRAPTASPSKAPSNAPTITVVPSDTPTISNAPSVSREPSLTPSSGPSAAPTTSRVPSPSPSTPVPTVTATAVPSVSASPSDAPTLSVGGAFAEFWLEFLTGGQAAEYAETVLGWVRTILVWWFSE